MGLKEGREGGRGREREREREREEGGENLVGHIQKIKMIIFLCR
jgi:hypothetical protein